MKVVIGHLQSIIEDCKRVNAESEKEHTRKMEYLQKNINEYEKR